MSDMSGFFKILISYFKRHIALIIAAVFAVIIFALVFSLYDLPVEAVGYAALICFAVFVIIGILRFCSFYKRHKTLMWLEKKLENEFEDFPLPLSIIEEDYQNICRMLYESRSVVSTKADRAISDMTDYYTMWAHQIKTPIAAIRLLLQSCSEDENNELMAELFKIEQYVEMVLVYVRASVDSSDYVIKKYNVDEIARGAVRKFSRMFILKKITLDYRVSAKLVLTDEKWLSFVIEQLLSNAIKYTPPGGRISIYMECGEKLVVEDSGIGIAPEDLPRVFDKGYTGFNGRAEKKSTGIGLYLCKKILDALGHKISVESNEGIGTKVTLNLKMYDSVME